MKQSSIMLRRPGVRGFALIEALIAVVVLATGLLALTALQGALMRSSADSKARSQVAAYAASEMDRIRTGNAVTAKAATSAGTDDISLAARAAGLSTLSQTVSAATYYANASGNFATTNPNTGKNAWFRRVTLNLGWTDATGGSRSLSMTTDISPLALTSSKVLVDREPSDDTGLRPIVRRPSPVTEGMIPIAVSGSEDTAATNPKPLLVGQKDNTLVSDTRFDVLTYSPGDNLGNTSFVRFNKRIETAMVGCSCQTELSGFPTGGSSPPINVLLKQYAFRPSYWDGARYTEPKRAGVPVTSPNLAVAQSQLCDVCCRDHRDESATGPKFNPWTSGTHAHYLDPAGSPVLAGKYIEACRVIRTNGVWRVTPDPRLDDLSLVATQVFPHTTGSGTAPADNNRATSPGLSSSGIGAYTEFAFAAIKALFYDQSTFDAGDAQESSGLNQPDYVPIKKKAEPLDKRWLHARGLLRDFLEQDAIDRLKKAKDDCTGTAVTDMAQCVLPYSPLATINATELAIWSARVASSTGIKLTGTLLSSATNFAHSALRKYPSAIALFRPISPEDKDTPRADEQVFALSNAESGDEEKQWLWVASPSGVIFGNAENPSRGFATVPPYRFNVSWNGVEAAGDDDKSNDPQLEVGVKADYLCNPNGADGTSNPYLCPSLTATNVELVAGGYNRLKRDFSTTSTQCGQLISEGQAVCLVHTLDSITGAVLVKKSKEVITGPDGKSNEVTRFTLDKISTTEIISIGLNFSSTSKTATAVCDVTFLGWKCD